jgi:two-component system, sensor histidine kinase
MTSDHDQVPSAPVDDRETQPMAAVRRILVVDDVRANLFALEAALEPLGLPVLCVTSGQAALTSLLDEDFCLLLLDVKMPDMDGLETAELIRSRRRTRHLPIMFVTAHDPERDLVRRAYRLGAVDFLLKPVDAEILVAKARVLVTLQQQADTLAAERLRRDFEAARRDYEHAALRRQMAALADEDKRKDRFLAVLSHELRNPLAAIRSAIDLQRTEADARLAPQRLAILDRQVTHLTRLVDDLLDLSRIKADRIDLRRSVTDLRDIVGVAVAECVPLLAARGHEFEAFGPDAPVWVDADPARVAQVIANLVSNACRYTDPGGQIELACDVFDGQAVVRVRDSGQGIAPEMIDRVFEPFVQERLRDDGRGGLGLGLALARQLVELHGGKISARSAGRGKGSIFELVLPLAVAPVQPVVPEPAEPEAVEPTPASSPPGGRRLTAVIVDDSDDLREMLAELLGKRGHKVLLAADGKAALAIIRDAQPDLALVDLGLPDIDGVELARELRANCPGLATRLVAMTGRGQPSDVARTRDAGFHEHLVKPVSMDQLLGLMQTL